MTNLLDSVESQIQECLTELAPEGKAQAWTDARWTEELKNRVGRIGESLKYKVFASKSNYSEHGEWLYDMIWLEINRGYVLDIPLVLECEWTPRGVDDDFQKLLVARAHHRVMVFSRKPRRSARESIKDLIDQVKQCKASRFGDRYLFACWDEKESKFVFDLHISR